MAHPGMAPVFSDAHETSPGSYEAHVNFSMGGDWVLLLHVTLADGRKFDKQVDVKGVEPVDQAGRSCEPSGIKRRRRME